MEEILDLQFNSIFHRVNVRRIIGAGGAERRLEQAVARCLERRTAVLHDQREIVLTEASTLPMRLDGLDLELRPRSFFQTNTPVAEALNVASRSRKRIHENFAMSVGYNIVAVPFAMVGMASPLLAAVAMSASSICVTLNALRLR